MIALMRLGAANLVDWLVELQRSYNGPVCRLVSIGTTIRVPRRRRSAPLP